MRLLEPMLVAVLAGLVSLATPALAQQKNPPPKKPPVIINDPSLYRPPPPPHERTYPQGPSTAPPMERIPQVKPLDRPPIR
jgi:hypothetical protein